MKKITSSILALITISLFVISCSSDPIEEGEIALHLDANFRVSESSYSDINTTTRSSDEEGEHCLVVNLIAGQHHIAGTVTVDLIGEDLIITYSTNQDWTIGATHMSIGNCEDQTIPTTGSGNPKVGHFEHSSTHNDGVHEVTYTLDASVLNDNYCFAAHAEVSGPTGGETAWAEGEGFDGNNWAMYVSALLSDCEGGGIPPVEF